MQANGESQSTEQGTQDVHIERESTRAAKKEQAIRNRSASVFIQECKDCPAHEYTKPEHNNLDGFGSKKPKVLLVFSNCHTYNNTGTMGGQVVEVKELSFKIANIIKRLETIGISRRDIRTVSALRCITSYCSIYKDTPAMGMSINKIDVKKQIRTCRNKVLDEINEHDPEMIILFGPEAVLSVLNKTDSNEMKTPGAVFKRDGRTILCSYHPTSDNLGAINIHLNKIPYLLAGGIETDQSLKYKTIKTTQELDLICDYLKKQKGFVFDFEIDTKLDKETSGFDSTDKLICMGISWAPNKAVIIPLDHEESPFKDNAYVKQKVKELLVSDVPKCAHNALYDCYAAFNFFDGLKVKNVVFDTMLAHHVLDPERGTHGLKYLATKYTKFGGYEDDILEDINKLPLEDRTYGKLSLGKLATYCALDVDVTFQLWQIFAKELNKDGQLLKLFNDISIPCHDLMFDLRTKGWVVSEDKLEELRTYYKTEVDNLNLDLKTTLEMPELNLSSPHQLREVFKKLNLGTQKTTPSGQASTDEDAIKKMLISDISEHSRSILEKILKYRKYNKALTTYVEGFSKHVKNGIVQTEYLIIGTSSGRLASLRPNMTNISADLEGIPTSKKIKSMFTAPKDYLIACCDYSQIELRNLGNIANEDVIIDTFLEGKNLHIQTTSDAFGIAYEDVEKDSHLYRAGKTLNFSIAYGAGYKRVAQSIKESALMTKPEITDIIKKLHYSDFTLTKLKKQFALSKFKTGKLLLDELYEMLAIILIDNINQRWPNVMRWKKEIYEKAQKDQKVVSPFGRVRYLNQKKLSKGNFFNISINHPIQSVSSDCLMLAMIALNKELKQHKSYIIGSVHDSVIMYIHKDEKDSLKPIVVNILESEPIKYMPEFFKIPMKVGSEIGENWAEMYKW